MGGRERCGRMTGRRTWEATTRQNESRRKMCERTESAASCAVGSPDWHACMIKPISSGQPASACTARPLAWLTRPLSLLISSTPIRPTVSQILERSERSHGEEIASRSFDLTELRHSSLSEGSMPGRRRRRSTAQSTRDVGSPFASARVVQSCE